MDLRSIQNSGTTAMAMVSVVLANDEKMVVGDRDQHGISPAKVLMR